MENQFIPVDAPVQSWFTAGSTTSNMRLRGRGWTPPCPGTGGWFTLTSDPPRLSLYLQNNTPELHILHTHSSKGMMDVSVLFLFFTLLLLLSIRGSCSRLRPVKGSFLRGLLSYQQLLPLLPSPPFHLLPVRVVQTAEPDTFDLLVAAATGVAVAVVSEDEASGAAGHNGVTADGSLRGTQTANGKHRQLTLNINIR